MLPNEYRAKQNVIARILTLALRKLVYTLGIPLNDADSKAFATVALPHMLRARQQSYVLAMAMMQQTLQAADLPFTQQDLPVLRPYKQEAFEQLLRRATTRNLGGHSLGDYDSNTFVHDSEGRVVSRQLTDRIMAAGVRHAEAAGRDAVVDSTDTYRTDHSVDITATDDDFRYVTGEEDTEEPFEYVTGGEEDEPEEPGTDLGDDNEPEEAQSERVNIVGWARVLTGRESCGFCAMLASRGPVYKSQTDAAYVTTRSQRYSTQLAKTYHDHCDCIAIPVIYGQHWDGEDAHTQLEQLWMETGAHHSGKQAAKAFTQALKEKQAEDPNYGVTDSFRDKPNPPVDVPPPAPPTPPRTSGDDDDLPKPRAAEEWKIARYELIERNFQHVIYGEIDNEIKGGHKAGLGRNNKTEFPPSWDDDKIKQALLLVESEPHAARQTRSTTVRLREVDGVLIRMQTHSSNGMEIFDAAYPINGHGVMVNKGSKKLQRPLSRKPIDRMLQKLRGTTDDFR